MLEDKLLGGIMGVLVGDALGLPVQFKERAEVQKNPVQGMIGYGTYNLPPGTWSDDGSLTLCLVESLCDAGYDIHDLSRRFIRWYEDGYWTPFGESFDVGNTTADAMKNLIDGIHPLKAGPCDEWSNGNGSLMRILPAAIYFAREPERAMIEKISEISSLTHRHPRSQLACCLYTVMVKELLDGHDPLKAYDKMRITVTNAFPGSRFSRELHHFERILNGSLPGFADREICSSGYVVHTLEAALWCLLKHHNFKDTLLEAVNLGDDSDTVGAVAGGLAGVAYGFQSIPKEWVQALSRYDEIHSLATRFVEKVCTAWNT